MGGGQESRKQAVPSDPPQEDPGPDLSLLVSTCNPESCTLPHHGQASTCSLATSEGTSGQGWLQLQTVPRKSSRMDIIPLL